MAGGFSTPAVDGCTSSSELSESSEVVTSVDGEETDGVPHELDGHWQTNKKHI